MPVSRIKELDHAELRTMENNPNKGTERGERSLRQSITKHGPGRSIGISADGVAFAGNHVLEVAAELGIPVTAVQTWGDTLIAVQRMDINSDDPRFMEMAIADNKTAQDGIEWDFAVLDAAKEEGIPLDDWFYDSELSAEGLATFGEKRSKKLTGVKSELAEQSEIDLEKIRVGDSFILGRHRLRVGLPEKRGDVAVMIAAWEAFTGQKAMRDLSLHELDDIDEDE
jgi:hypothetical protein